MRIQKYTISKKYLANYGGIDRHLTEKFPVIVSNKLAIITALEQAIKDDQDQTIQSLLKADFIFPDPLQTTWKMIFCNTQAGHFQRNDEEYAYYKITPTLEALINCYPEDFYKLYNLTNDKPECRKALLDFSDLNLFNTDLKKIDFSLTNFCNANIRQAKGITQKVLDKCISYDFAKLPSNIVQLWSSDKAKKILNNLAKRKEYGTYLALSNNKATKSKGILLRNHADLLINQVLSSSKHDNAFQAMFIETLNKHNQIFDKPRFYDLKMIFANILFCILGVGVFYAAAVGVHYASTGRALFFSRTRSRELVDQTKDSLLQQPVTNYLCN